MRLSRCRAVEHGKPRSDPFVLSSDTYVVYSFIFLFVYFTILYPPFTFLFFTSIPLLTLTNLPSLSFCTRYDFSYIPTYLFMCGSMCVCVWCEPKTYKPRLSSPNSDSDTPLPFSFHSVPYPSRAPPWMHMFVLEPWSDCMGPVLFRCPPCFSNFHLICSGSSIPCLILLHVYYHTYQY